MTPKIKKPNTSMISFTQVSPFTPLSSFKPLPSITPTTSKRIRNQIMFDRHQRLTPIPSFRPITTLSPLSSRENITMNMATTQFSQDLSQYAPQHSNQRLNMTSMKTNNEEINCKYVFGYKLYQPKCDTGELIYAFSNPNLSIAKYSFDESWTNLTLELKHKKIEEIFDRVCV